MNTMPDLGSINLFSALDTMLWIIFGVLTVIYVVLSIILHHHWNNYGITKKRIKRLSRLYFGVSGVLFVSMAASLIIWIL